MTRRFLSATGLAALLGGSGCLHFAVPGPYRSIVPSPLRGVSAEVVALSGAAEIACAGLLLLPPTRRLGALAAVALLVAVLPANIQMALNGGAPQAPFPINTTAAAWLRVPLQIPLVLWALSLSRQGDRVDSGRHADG